MLTLHHVGACWCMPMHADACWFIWIHVMLEVCWLLGLSKDVEGPWNHLKPCCSLSLGFSHRIVLRIFKDAFSSNLARKHWLRFAQEFSLDLRFCGCCSGEPFAKGDLDAEWDAMARHCPASCWGAVCMQCLYTIIFFLHVDVCWCTWWLKFVDCSVSVEGPWSNVAVHCSLPFPYIFLLCFLIGWTLKILKQSREIKTFRHFQAFRDCVGHKSV